MSDPCNITLLKILIPNPLMLISVWYFRKNVTSPENSSAIWSLVERALSQIGSWSVTSCSTPVQELINVQHVASDSSWLPISEITKSVSILSSVYTNASTQIATRHLHWKETWCCITKRIVARPPRVEPLPLSLSIFESRSSQELHPIFWNFWMNWYYKLYLNNKLKFSAWSTHVPYKFLLSWTRFIIQISNKKSFPKNWVNICSSFLKNLWGILNSWLSNFCLLIGNRFVIKFYDWLSKFTEISNF
jgi:hypothetical protein